MRKRWSIFLIVWMLMLGTVSAEQSEEVRAAASDWTAYARDGVISVYDLQGDLMNRMEYSAELVGRELLIADDYNFDGKTDLAALIAQGTVNSYFTLWLRTEDGGFEHCPALEEICAPVLNEDAHLIESFERNSAFEYRQSIYAWADGDLVQIKERYIEYLDGANVRLTEHAETSIGVLTAVREIPVSEWEGIQAAEGQAHKWARKLYANISSPLYVFYAGKKQVDGEVYDIFRVETDWEGLCLIGFETDDPSAVWMDDTADGEVRFARRLDEDGSEDRR